MSSNPLPVLTPAQLVGLSYVWAGSPNQRLLRPLRRALESNPRIRRELDVSGGFDFIVDRASRDPQEQVNLERLFQIQDTLLSSTRVDNRLDQIPCVQEEFESLKDITKITTAIKSQLSECCDEITGLLRALKKSLTAFRDAVNKNFTQASRVLSAKLDQLKADLVGFYNEEKASFLSALPNLKAEVYSEFRKILQEELGPLKDKLNSIESTLDRNFPSINDELALLKASSGDILTVVGSTELTLGTYIGTWELWVITNTEAQTAGFAGIGTAFLELNGVIGGKTILGANALRKATNRGVSEVNKFTKTKWKDWTCFSKDVKKGLPFILTNEVCQNIVGESYYKWDALACFYPTIVFVFVEQTQNNKPRKAQIKLRLKQTSASITENDVAALITRAEACAGLSYTYGNARGNYVSLDKRFKTTIFAKDEASLNAVLNKVLGVILEPFDPALLSITNTGSKRPSINKRLTALHAVGVNNTNYNENFSLGLKSINVLINGLKRIIKL